MDDERRRAAHELVSGSRALVAGQHVDLGALGGSSGVLAEGEGAEAKLAASCTRFLAYLAAGEISEPDALLVFASTAEALAAGQERVGITALEGARFELESFFPVPGRPGPKSPDVPVTALRRKRS